MNRTFPDNIKFRQTADPCLQDTLYNVLVAYGHHNKAVGYCQVCSHCVVFFFPVLNAAFHWFCPFECALSEADPQTISVLKMALGEKKMNHFKHVQVPL